MIQGNPRRWFGVSCVCLASLALGSVASATESAADRHPRGLLSPANKPAGVPSGYVLTHAGFFHPSCVVTVRSDETVGADLVIRGMDGAEHVQFQPCAYPSYTVGGAPMGKASHAPSVEHAPVTYDGYIVYYSYEGSLAAGTALSTQWTVPLAPVDTADQDIAFFNDILTSAGGGNILQPVLDYNGEDAHHWAIESENCCISGNDVQSTIVPVNAGDVILGTVTGTGCDSTGVCQAWTITTTDMTTGKSTTNNTTAPMGVPNGVSPGSLETYGVTACNMFPASGEVTFVDNAVTSGDGGTEKLKYDLLTLQGVAAEVPRNCGYGGSTSGNSYTLIFGTPSANDGGAVDAGGGLDAGGALDGAIDGGAGVDSGAMDASIDGSDGGPPDASEDSSSGNDSSGGGVDAVASNDASSPDGGVDASVDSSGDAPTQSSDAAAMDSAIAMEAAAGIDSGSSYEAGNTGASDGGVSATEGPSGCGCALVGTNDDFGMGSLGSSLCLLLALGARQRRRGTCEDRET